MGLSASCFGFGATLSNFLGQLTVEKFGHVESLAGSFFLSLIPICLFTFMPETLGIRTIHSQYRRQSETASTSTDYNAVV